MYGSFARPPWGTMLQYSEKVLYWCLIGDFNVISFTHEKLGGRDYQRNKSFEFISVIESFGLLDIGCNVQP